MSDDLKPCPWCGAAAEFFHGGVRRYARCSNAEAAGGACSVGYRTDDDWNTRPVEDALCARAEAAEQRAEALAAELAQAQADGALLAGLWLATVPPDVLPALLPTAPGDRDRLAAALDAVDLQASEAAHIAAGRAVIARIVAEMGGGAA